MKTVEDYTKIGFDQKTAEYFSSGRKKIVSVVPFEDKKLLQLLAITKKEYWILNLLFSRERFLLF